ncbi:MAG TPA: PspC domain-containing protein [Acidimicrobiales bacterium]|nr:PspC domain-containing protein [Acidimicrobiales bacterium]
MDTAPHENPTPEPPEQPSGQSAQSAQSATEPPEQPAYGAGTGGSGSGGDVQHLHRVGRGRMLAGVAGGIADYFDVDPTLVRIGFVALALLGGLAVPLYAAGWLLIPDEESDVSVAEELLARERARGAY